MRMASTTDLERPVCETARATSPERMEDAQNICISWSLRTTQAFPTFINFMPISWHGMIASPFPNIVMMFASLSASAAGSY